MFTFALRYVISALRYVISALRYVFFVDYWLKVSKGRKCFIGFRAIIYYY